MRQSPEFHNSLAADWADLNLRQAVRITPLFSSTIGTIVKYFLCFCVPGTFLALGVVAYGLGVRDRYVVNASIIFGLLMLVPSSLIAFLGRRVSKNFVSSLDKHGVSGSGGQRYAWGHLYYVDHVTKHMRAGHVGRRVKDNQIEMVFASGKLIIPPLIRDRERIWELINRIPAEIRDDGVPRKRAEDIEKAFFEFLNNA